MATSGYRELPSISRVFCICLSLRDKAAGPSDEYFADRATEVAVSFSLDSNDNLWPDGAVNSGNHTVPSNSSNGDLELRLCACEPWPRGDGNTDQWHFKELNFFR
jgi:hypothetical protein